MLKVIYERSFEKNLKRVIKRGHNIKKLRKIIALLIEEKKLPAKNRNHKLHGNLKNYHECHIEPDWLLIYKKTETAIILARTGSHSDLF